MKAPCATAFAGRPAKARLAAPAVVAGSTADSEGTGGASRMRRGPFVVLKLALMGGLLYGGMAFASEAQLILVAGDVRLQRSSSGPSAIGTVPTNGMRVQGGDTLVTGDNGRAQIRFSDGSLVSLQPRSEFRIDDYQFDLAQQRGFFSLVRGALRTISGAVGKRDPADYRMTTPTATIGIRGTEFVVEETVCTPACHPGRTAGLRVAVSAGHVVVYNAAGTIEVPAGQATYVADAGRAPVPTTDRPTMSTAPSSIDFGVPASGTRLAVLTPGRDATAGPRTAAPAAAQRRVAVSASPRQTGAESDPASAGGSATGGRSTVRTIPDRQLLGMVEGVPAALLDQWSTRQLPVQVAAPSLAAAAPKAGKPAEEAPGPRTEAGGAGDRDDLAAATDTPPAVGGAESSDPDFNRPTAPVAGRPGGADPVVVAALAPVGGSSIPVGDATGTNNQRGPDGLPISVGGIGPGVGGPGDGSGNGGGDSGHGGPGHDAPGNGDPGNGDPGNGDPGNGDPGNGDPGNGDPGNGDPGNGDPGNGGSPVLTPGFNDAARISVRTLQSSWFGVDLTAANSHVKLDDEYRLESVGLCPMLLCVSRGTAQVVDAGYNSDVSWGRWVNGVARFTIAYIPVGNHTLGNNNGVHYLVGVPTASMPTSGSAYYSFAGATSPTFASGAVAPGTFTGQGMVQFASGLDTRVGFKGDMVFGSGERYHLFSNGARTNDAGKLVEIGNTEIRMTGRNTFSGDIGVVSQGSSDRLACGTSNCRANVQGGFFGPAAARMGVGYTVRRETGGGDTINGVAVLDRQ